MTDVTQATMTDRIAIETLLNTYSLAYDSRDLATMESCFAADAVFSMQIAGQEPVSFDGRATIMKLMTDSMASQTDQRRHINSNLLVSEEDGVVRTTSYLTLVATEGNQIQLLSSGVYRNEIVEDGGVLRFRRLHLDLDKSY
ncbi:nuclear transport factor 2 family protein [Paeniglutamicibacter sp. ORCA_105]|uniref:nuclear transport factor 2 family protein n=1 Tax=Paeniglutamicibacter sp. ORCA_105 TaxID=3377336 RepID=UPI0038938B58